MEDISFQQTTEEVISLATIYAGNYVDFVENLPFELQRSVTRLREIDCTCREVLSEIEALYSTFTKDKDISLKRRTTLIQIQRLFCRCQELGDEKISIVQQMTETIENKKKVVEHSNYRFKSAYLPELKNEFGEKREPHKPDNHRGTKRSRRHRHHYSEKHQEKVILEDIMHFIDICR
ncbi:unnamed protein product [Clavelina lepadiformis]|uniref:Inhibitor of growth protein N-terminal histone-binding domain-containing protein n=1 Tax=Clavelina lepadiformis TaxID=159417 RepID=A0ABP0F438_CLALP